MTFTEHLFELINAHHINYCVLRNYQSLPYSTAGSDLDIWVETRDLCVFYKVLNKCITDYKWEIVTILNSKICPHICILGKDRGIQVDLFIGNINYKEAILINEKYIKKNIIQYKSIKVLDEETDKIISFLKEMLNNKKCDLKRFTEAAITVNQIDQSKVNELLINFDLNIRIKIIKLLECNQYNPREIKKLGNAASNNLVTIPIQIKY